jgi:hypothetical protein
MKNSNLYEFDSEKDSNSLISEKTDENEEEEEAKIDIKLITSISNTFLKVVEGANKNSEIKQIIRNQ